MESQRCNSHRGGNCLWGAERVQGPTQHAAFDDNIFFIAQVEHIAGGATQNSIRVAQWLLGGQVIMMMMMKMMMIIMMMVQKFQKSQTNLQVEYCKIRRGKNLLKQFSSKCDHDCDHHQANPELCSYMGCVGKDDSSRILAEKVSLLIFSNL